MPTTRHVLEGTEKELALAALAEYQRSLRETEAVFARRLAPVRIAHQVPDGIRSTFGVEGEEVLMVVETPEPPGGLAVVPEKVRRGKR